MIPKTKTATSFRQDLYDSLKAVADGDTLVVTQKQGGNVVLISQDEYNRILGERELLRSIATGVGDLEAGRKHDHKDAVSRLKKIQSKWK